VLQTLGAVLLEKDKAEQHLIRSGLSYTILRPGGLKSEPATGNGVLTEDPRVGGTIHRADVAALACRCLASARARNRVLSAIDRQMAYGGGDFEVVRAVIEKTGDPLQAVSQDAPSCFTAIISPADRVQVLAEALPYIQRFAGKTIVVKYGGAAMVKENLRDLVIRDIVFLATVGIKPVVVHGGGPEINSWLERLNIPVQFVGGLRVTDKITMEVVEMVLAGKVNKSIVQMINQAGGSAVGLCGRDGSIIEARPHKSAQLQPDIGFVGDIQSVNPKLIQSLLKEGHIPVLSSVASDENGQAYNINADTAAGELAAALDAEKLILLTDTPGILLDKDHPRSLIRKLDIYQARKLIAEGVVDGGMIPKVQCCVRALAQGVRAAHIVDGRQMHALLLEVLTDQGIGSMLVASELV
jgi:acetylglutamate kinase